MLKNKQTNKKYNLPLYDMLLKDIDKSKRFKKNDTIELADNIKKCDENGKNLIYILIRYFQIQNGGVETEMPYKSTYEHKNFSFSISELPSLLKKILLAFTITHLKKAKEETVITKYRDKKLNDLTER